MQVREAEEVHHRFLQCLFFFFSFSFLGNATSSFSATRISPKCASSCSHLSPAGRELKRAPRGSPVCSRRPLRRTEKRKDISASYIFKCLEVKADLCSEQDWTPDDKLPAICCSIKYLPPINCSGTKPDKCHTTDEIKRTLQSLCLAEFGHQSFLSGHLLCGFIQDIYNHNELRQNTKLLSLCLRVI